ncbi:endonuclease domain-containing 1 protein-like [Synchiropus splendidus]|uniref:endonuclease domain-containing 1 protein-like n=1 Tax=Synchiropus splendidus TaxID=270530 RepID=UPI00237EB967|nr:endonuclease domain-containing 1 protein-like [Synchiropus splendidus]
MLLLLSLLLWAAVCCPAGADVGNFSSCLDFFYKSWPPKGLTGTPLCQRFLNQYRFASLYSRPRRSPWFSAYKYEMPLGKRPRKSWKFEPQLVNSGADGNMSPFPPGPLDWNLVESQAVNPDYFNSTYSRGHLNPSLHHRSHDDRVATFTLTNAVPQKKWSNDGPWAFLEQSINRTLGTYCLGASYIVTGIMPYVKDEHWLKNRVAVPEYMWSAYCCPNYRHNLPRDLSDNFPTYAAIGRNDPNSTEEIVPVDPKGELHFRGYDVRTMPLKMLEMYLSERFGSDIRLFYQSCPGLH